MSRSADLESVLVTTAVINTEKSDPGSVCATSMVGWLQFEGFMGCFGGELTEKIGVNINF